MLHRMGARAPSPRLLVGDAAVAGGLALLLYLATLSPGLFWGDSAALASALDAAPSPFARSYWPFRITARSLGLALGLRPSLAANVASALWGALAVGLTHAAAQRLGKSRLAAAAAAAGLAVAHTPWCFAVVAEVYTPHLAIQAALMLLALGAAASRSERLAFGLLLGLSMLHHRMALLLWPALCLGVLAATPKGERIACARDVSAAALLGLLPFAALCALHPPGSLPPGPGVPANRLWFEQVFLGGHASAGELLAGPGKPLAENFAYLVRWTAWNFPSPALPLALTGALLPWLQPRAPSAPLLACTLLSSLIIALAFGWTGDQFSFLIPLHGVLSLLIAVGLAPLVRTRRRLAATLAALCLLAPPLLYATAASTELGSRLVPGLAASPDARAQLLWPGKAGWDYPERWSRALLQALPRDAMLVSGYHEGAALRHLQHTLGARPDVTILLLAGPRPPALDRSRPCFASWDPLRGAQGPDPDLLATGWRIRQRGPGIGSIERCEERGRAR
jgi:hypothetical protein